MKDEGVSDYEERVALQRTLAHFDTPSLLKTPFTDMMQGIKQILLLLCKISHCFLVYSKLHLTLRYTYVGHFPIGLVISYFVASDCLFRLDDITLLNLIDI